MAARTGGSAQAAIEALFHDGVLGTLSDGELLDRFGRSGAPAERAFATLVERHGPMVLRTCQMLLQNPDDAQDAFQVTFLVLARKAGSIRSRESVAGWLHGVASRTAAYARGGQARRRRHEKAAAARTALAVHVPEPDDRAEVVQEEVGRLPEHLRLAVLLCELEGLSLEAAAGRLGCPVGTVKSRLSRARERLRHALNRRGLGPDEARPMPIVVPPALVKATVAATCRGEAGGVVTAALAAWKSGVIRAMFLTKFKAIVSVALVGLTLVGGSALLVRAQAVKPDRPAATVKVEAGGKSLAPEQLVDALAVQRIKQAREIKDIEYRRYRDDARNIATYIAASDRFLESVLDSVETAQRVTALRFNLEDAITLLRTVKEKHAKDQATQADVVLAEYHRTDAALRLAEAATGRRPSLNRTADIVVGLSLSQRLPEALDAFIQEQRSDQLLRTPVTLDYPDPISLSEILKALKGASTNVLFPGNPIYVDPDGLKKAGVTLETRVKLPHFSGTQEEALHRVLDPLGLSFSVKDGLVWITAK